LPEWQRFYIIAALAKKRTTRLRRHACLPSQPPGKLRLAR
jgi:hypothetical protein